MVSITVDHTMAEINRLTLPIGTMLDMYFFDLAIRSSSKTYSLDSSVHLSHTPSVSRNDGPDSNVRDASMFLLLMARSSTRFHAILDFLKRAKIRGVTFASLFNYQTNSLCLWCKYSEQRLPDTFQSTSQQQYCISYQR